MLKLLNSIRTEFNLKTIKTDIEKQYEKILQSDLPKDKDYTLKTIKSCRNKLHIDFSIQMVELFHKKYSHIDVMSTLELKEAINDKCQQLTI